MKYSDLLGRNLADAVEFVDDLKNVAIEVEIYTHQVGDLAAFFSAALGSFKEVVVIIENGRIDTAGRGAGDPMVQ